MPCTATMASPGLIQPRSLPISAARRMILSVPIMLPMTCESTPRSRPRHWFATSGVAVSASTGMAGRYLEIRRAELPVSVHTTIILASMSMLVLTAADAMASVTDTTPSSSRVLCRTAAYSCAWLVTASASEHTAAIMRTACNGYSPPAVSPLSMTASLPSSTAFATSVHSARVGRGLDTIDSSICVAVTTGLPTRLALRIIIFCARKTFSGGISMPRSPRATIMASVVARISS
mmetsp:Transcript_20699/g.73123  ORF Transcript_20699/g.73123 Transcript_20699/m.73123 type:complete len:234 (+) Transcript_20699:83-784(+)